MRKAREREANIENRLMTKVKSELDGIAYKFTSPSRRSVPDRLCVWGQPGQGTEGFAVFVEVKATGEKPTNAQLREHARLRGAKQIVEVVDSYEAVDELIEDWKGW